VGPEQLAAAGVQVDGDVSAVGRLLAALDEPDPDFAIVTP
jgi:alkyl sulfatase BDS1-like metallo-beta-lactamase superfamily hydrolase